MQLGKPHVFARIHFEIEAEGVRRVRFDDFLHEFHENGVLAEDGELVHRFEIDSDKERPGQLRIDALPAFDTLDFGDFEELHASVHHHLLDASGSDLGLKLVKDDVVNHGR